MTDGAPQNGGYRQSCHRPFRGALLLPARVALNEEFIACCFGGGLGVSTCSFGEPLSRLARAEWVRPPRRAGWVSPSPDSPEAVPLAGSQVPELAVFTPHFRCQQKSDEGRAMASLL